MADGAEDSAVAVVYRPQILFREAAVISVAVERPEGGRSWG